MPSSTQWESTKEFLEEMAHSMVEAGKVQDEAGNVVTENKEILRE